MIKDIANCREIHLGHGTVGIGIDITETVGILYNKPYTPVGNSDNRFVGELATKLDEKNVCLFFDGKEGIAGLDILIHNLQKIRTKLKGEKIMDVINNKLDNDFSMVFKHGLIAQIRQAGGTFNPEIMDDGGNMHQKKFFAFKFDPKGDIENQILYQIPRMFEIVDQHRCDELSNEWQDIEFNVAKLENLRDGETFVDLYRGLVFFRRKAND